MFDNFDFNPKFIIDPRKYFSHNIVLPIGWALGFGFYFFLSPIVPQYAALRQEICKF